MKQEEINDILRTAILECGSIREGLALFREVTGVLRGTDQPHAPQTEAAPPPPPDPTWAAPAAILSQAMQPSEPPRAPSPRMHHRPWTRDRCAQAQQLANKGLDFEAIGKALGRTTVAMYGAWYTGKFEMPGMTRPVRVTRANGLDPHPDARPETGT